MRGTYLMRGLAILISSVLLPALFSCADGIAVRSFNPEADGKPIYNAVCYGPHRDGQRPGGKGPSAPELLEDLRLIQPHWNLIRVYGSAEFAETMLSVIRENDLDIKVMLGAWIAPEEDSPDAAAANEREIAQAIRLAGEFPSIVAAVSVGNETQVFWSGHRTGLDILIGHVDRVRESVSVPVTVADDFNFWNKPESRKLSSRIDFITMHAHPMWNGQLLDGALGWLEERVAEVQALHPSRKIVIGETGWATSVHDEGEQGELIIGSPGEEEQKFFYDTVREWASAGGRTVFFFEAFDENWKGGDHPAEVEKHWGMFRADRSPKAAMIEEDPVGQEEPRDR
ncbi:MAG TPA: glycosyl hydrolase family 17 protein [Candidatus Krumholzibacterium sp.]|nr:glycosyl hydrolase family 17 protein [Candidatus Krumholzibacterium sp.]